MIRRQPAIRCQMAIVCLRQSYHHQPWPGRDENVRWLSYSTATTEQYSHPNQQRRRVLFGPSCAPPAGVSPLWRHRRGWRYSHPTRLNDRHHLSNTPTPINSADGYFSAPPFNVIRCRPGNETHGASTTWGTTRPEKSPTRLSTIYRTMLHIYPSLKG